MPALVYPDSKILILGTMPGEKSLEENQYYANRGNQFWKLLYAVFDQPFSAVYEERKAFLKALKIGVWDVLETCEREGSLDSNISCEVPHDFDTFYKKHPQLTHVFFSSKNAEKYYAKFVGRNPKLSYHVLPSPSGAYPLAFAEKLKKWSALRDVLGVMV